MNITFTATGIKPMIQHNGRLANPLDFYTRQLREITSKRNKTFDDISQIALIEARGSCWETPDGLVGVPANALWRSIYDAAKAFKLGEDIKRGLLIADEFVPLLIDGKTKKAEDYVPDNFDYRPVVIQRKRTMRARVKITQAWKFKVQAVLLDDVLDLHRLTPVFERAGSLVGIGDWRPIYGTYQLEVK